MPRRISYTRTRARARKSLIKYFGRRTLQDLADSIPRMFETCSHELREIDCVWLQIIGIIDITCLSFYSRGLLTAIFSHLFLPAMGIYGKHDNDNFVRGRTTAKSTIFMVTAHREYKSKNLPERSATVRRFEAATSCALTWPTGSNASPPSLVLCVARLVLPCRASQRCVSEFRFGYDESCNYLLRGDACSCRCAMTDKCAVENNTSVLVFAWN